MNERLTEILVKALKLAGAIVGAAAGAGIVAFLTGYLAQRAQHQLADVPLVFIDYWSYAEVGLNGMLASAYSVLSNVGLLAAIIFVSVLIILMLEFAWFRSLLDQAPLYFVSLLLLVGLLAIVVNQQLAVRSLLTVDKQAETEVTEDYLGPETVPVRWPFGVFVSDRLSQPDLGRFELPVSDLEGFAALADDLQLLIAKGTRRLEVRPAPSWVRVGSEGDTISVVGQHVSEERLDSRRAQALQNAILAVMLLTVWLAVLAELWGRRLRDRLPSPESANNGILARFREEIWFSGRWVMRPLIGFLLGAALLLLPECDGLLAMPELGQEMVQVLLAETQADGPGPDSTDRREPAGRETASFVNKTFPGMSAELLVAARVTEAYPISSPMAQKNYRAQWTELLTTLQSRRTPEAIQTLERIAQMSLFAVPALAEEARNAWKQAALVASARRAGFLLHYPRSESSQLRLIERDQFSKGRPWMISPIPMSSVAEIRVLPDITTIRTVEILRGMDELDPDDRANAIIELMVIGHPQLLEINIAAAVSRAPNIAGAATTSIGRLASVLPDTPDGRLRRRRAITALISLVETEERRADWRGAAATALQWAAPRQDPQACTCLSRLMESEQAQAADPHWELRGTAMTSLSILQCPSGAEILVGLLEREGNHVPEHIRGAIPTALVNYPDAAIPALASLVSGPAADSEAIGTALTTLGILGPQSPEQAVAGVSTFLRRTDRFVNPDLKRLTEAGIDALRMIGSRESFEDLRWLIGREEPEQTRFRAVVAIGELGYPAAADLLWRLTRDTNEAESVRAAALAALGELSVDRIVADLIDYYHSETDDGLRRTCLEALAVRAAEGSSRARYFVEEQGLNQSLTAQLSGADDATEPEPPSDSSSEFDSGIFPTDVADPVEQRVAIEALTAGNPTRFLRVMMESYFDPSAWSKSIIPLFPAYNEAFQRAAGSISEEELPSGTPENWQLRQDLLAGWVIANIDALSWNPASGRYEMSED